MKNLALKLIRWYQKYLSFLNGPFICRFYPTCSEYTYQAISKYGILLGCLKGFFRILKCNPFYTIKNSKF